VLKWVDKLKPELTVNPPPAVAVAEAFSTARNWSRLRRWTRTGSWGKSDYLRLAYQAYAAKQTRQAGAEAEFQSLWRAAERATEEDPQRLVNLARLATRWNLFTEAEQLWLKVTKTAPLRREALDSLARIYRSTNDLPNLYRTMQGLHEISPGDVDVAANYARLGLLLDQNAAEAHRVAKEAYDRAPANVNCAVTYAFSLYGLGRTAAGIDIIRSLPPDQVRDPHAAAFVAVLLIDDNQFDPAREYIQAAQKGGIFPEEKKLVDEAVAKLNTPSPTPSGPATSPPPISVPVGPLPGIGTAPSSPLPAAATAPPRRELPLPTPDEP
jgi:hypothetical protein